MINESILCERLEPFLSLVCLLLGKGELDGVIVLRVYVLEIDCVLIDLGKVLLGLLGSGCTQTLVVFDLPAS